MELLSLFDTFIDEEAETEDQQTNSNDLEMALSPSVTITRELDYELLQDIEDSQISHLALSGEIEFLSTYCERFGFARDRIRLNTLHYYCGQQNNT